MARLIVEAGDQPEAAAVALILLADQPAACLHAHVIAPSKRATPTLARAGPRTARGARRRYTVRSSYAVWWAAGIPDPAPRSRRRASDLPIYRWTSEGQRYF